MTDLHSIEEQLAALPIYQYAFLRSSDLIFEPKVRQICMQECQMYGRTWSCPPGVGTLDQCRERCLKFDQLLLLSTVAEVGDIMNMTETLSTREEHEQLTRQVRDLFTAAGCRTFVLSSEACQLCSSCTYPDEPCRHPQQMQPCIESHCILVTALAEQCRIEFLSSPTVVTWFSLIFFD